MHRFNKISQGVALALWGAGLAASAFADESATPATAVADAVTAEAPRAEKAAGQSPDGHVVTLGRVVVTAQHREENIQDVPVAVSAVDTRNFQEQGERYYDIFTFVPNAAAENPDGESRPRIYIRGLGTGDTAASTVFPVGVYSDGVYLNAPVAAGGAVFDLERVEVLRGPQGTLYGKNTTGGAINYISRKPEFTDPNGHITLGLGSENQQTLDAAVGGKISGDWLAARVAFNTETRDGFTYNTKKGEDEGGIDRTALRVQFLAKPTDDLDILLNLHKRSISDNGSNGSLPLGTYYPGTAGQYTRPDGRIIENGVYSTGEIDHEGVGLTINKKLGNYLFTSITGYDAISQYALGGGGTASYENNSRSLTDNTWRQASQEFRLTSPQKEALRWITGLHYFQENLGSDAVAARYPQSVANLPLGAPTAQSASNPAFRETAYVQDTKSIAAYGNLTYDFTEKLSLTGGLRWTQEEKDLDISLLQYSTASFNAGNWWDVSSLVSPVFISTPGANGAQNRSETWSDWTWDLTPEYRINENLRTFFRYARGFRSGAFNVGIGGSLNNISTVRPEYLDSYEIGLKSEWLGGRLLANANIFYYDYTDIQTNLLIPAPTGGVVTALANGPKAEAKGAEFELDALPVDDLRLRLSIGLLQTEYTDFVNRNPLTGVVTANYTGNSLVRSPEVTAAVGVDYTIHLGDAGKLIAGADANYRSEEFFLVDRQNTSIDKPLSEDGYVLVNARLTYVTPDEKVRVAAYVNNATDELYQVHGRPNGSAANNWVITYGNPITWGLSVTTNF